MSQYTFTEVAIPEHKAGPGRPARENPFTDLVFTLANKRDKGIAFMLAYDPKDASTGTIDPAVNKELGRVYRDLNDAGARNLNPDGSPNPVTVRKERELKTDGRKTLGVQITVWAVDRQKRDRQVKVPDGTPETPDPIEALSE
jgi:hypothetical protein